MVMRLEDFQVYNLSLGLAESIHKIVIGWDYFYKDTIGKQLVRSVDSIAANLSEGLGRYHFKDRKNFAYYSRGSLFETKTWLIKAKNRDLITEEKFKFFISEIDKIGIKLNNYINTIGKKQSP